MKRSRFSEEQIVGILIEVQGGSNTRAVCAAHNISEGTTTSKTSDLICPTYGVRPKSIAASYSTVLVCLDSNHTHEHVIKELEAYAPLVSKGSYCVVFDTIVDDLPAEMFMDRAWGPGHNRKTAVREFVKRHPEFEIDKSIDHKLLISVAPDGFLKRAK